MITLKTTKMNSSNLKYYNTFILISKECKCSFSFALFISFLMFFIFNIVHFIMTGAILTYNKNMRTPDTDSICVKTRRNGD